MISANHFSVRNKAMASGCMVLRDEAVPACFFPRMPRRPVGSNARAKAALLYGGLRITAIASTSRYSDRNSLGCFVTVLERSPVRSVLPFRSPKRCDRSVEIAIGLRPPQNGGHDDKQCVVLDLIAAVSKERAEDAAVAENSLYLYCP